MKKLFCCSLLIMILTLSGCVMRLVPKEMDRVDQELTGNRGVIMGEPQDLTESAKEKRETRTVYDLEVEFTSPMDIERVKKEKTTDREKYGNKGYMQTKAVSEKNLSPIEEKKSGSSRLISSGPRVIYQQASGLETKKTKGKEAGKVAVPAEEKTYVVQKGDTLQKISEKMYGTTKKWKSIYDANKNILKGPDTIRVGQKLVIPAE